MEGQADRQPAWAEFLKTSDVEMRRNDLCRGLVFTPDRKASTAELVAEYMQGFGWDGVGLAEITDATQRDQRGVQRVLRVLTENGDVYIEEQTTRGPRASKRKVYHLTRSECPFVVLPG